VVGGDTGENLVSPPIGTVTMKTNLDIRKQTIPMGAGLYMKRWVLVQDGAIRETFLRRDEAERTLQALREDWESKDE